MSQQQKLAQLQLLWKKRFDDFKLSDMSASKFARVHNFSVHQFYYWKEKFEDQDKTESSARPAPSAAFVKLKAAPSRSEVVFPDPEWLARFIRALN